MIPPPVFPDVVHVANGCYVSAVTYVARFSAAFPAERAEPAAFVLPNAGGGDQPHTLAIVSWHGEWWARDEYFGVVPLGCPSASPWNPRLAQLRADAGFRRVAASQRREAVALREKTLRPPGRMGPDWRLAEVLAAQGILPFPSQIHWLHDGMRLIPFLYFRPGADRFAVYDPAIGTASAVSLAGDEASLVAAAVTRLGYALHRPLAKQGFAALPPPMVALGAALTHS
jgi:hypothetical protein